MIILVIVSCHLAYFRYPSGYRSAEYIGNFCAKEQKGADFWEEMLRYNISRYRTPVRTWGRSLKSKTGWKR